MKADTSYMSNTLDSFRRHQIGLIDTRLYHHRSLFRLITWSEFIDWTIDDVINEIRLIVDFPYINKRNSDGWSRTTNIDYNMAYLNVTYRDLVNDKIYYNVHTHDSVHILRKYNWQEFGLPDVKSPFSRLLDFMTFSCINRIDTVINRAISNMKAYNAK